MTRLSHQLLVERRVFFVVVLLLVAKNFYNAAIFSTEVFHNNNDGVGKNQHDDYNSPKTKAPIVIATSRSPHTQNFTSSTKTTTAVSSSSSSSNSSSSLVSSSSSSSSLLPEFEALEVFEQYKQWHSVESLRAAPENRTFVIGYYSCPNQAGNRLHHFFNSLLWAVVTNRTLLWKYYDKESCLQTNERYDAEICNSANRVEDCDAVLERASWIPSYDDDEWNQRLPLMDMMHNSKNNNNKNNNNNATVMNFWTTHPNVRVTKRDVETGRYTGTHLVGKRWYPWKDEYQEQIGLDNQTQHQVIILPIMPAKYQDLSDPRHRQTLLKHDWAREIARKLYSEGASFLYGMLFRESFRILNPGTMMSNSSSIRNASFSVALHSRHKYPHDQGNDVSAEQACLETLLQSRTNDTLTTSSSSSSSSCEIYLMSDRNVTLQKLSAFLETKSCTAIIAKHDAGQSFREEHGPFSGNGYFQDLALASKARNGFAGKRRSSSDLVSELIEYDRRMEARAAGRRIREDVPFCMV